MSKKINVGILYPADPLGNIPGGIDTFIRGLIDWAPDDIHFSLVGMTTDPQKRPAGQWTTCMLKRKSFDFFPLFVNHDPHQQPRFPGTLRYMLMLLPNLHRCRFDVQDSHRIEIFFPFFFARAPKNVFLHQNMDVINSPESDIRWKHFPWLYYQLEKLILKRISSIFVVREDAVIAYRKRYPEIAQRFNFTPTWMDPDTFFPLSSEQRQVERIRLFSGFGVKENTRVLIFVGRLDKQKNPLMLLSAFQRVCREHENLHLLMVGDGVLRQEVSATITELGLQEHVTLTGLLGVKDVAEYLRAADLFVLSSNYEGMPMCVLEALGSGLPVASTAVGEVGRVVQTGVNGSLAPEISATAMADAIKDCLLHLSHYRGSPCTQVASHFVPEKVLAPVYENYRILAGFPSPEE